MVSVVPFTFTYIQIVDLKTHKPLTVPKSNGFFSPRWSPHGRYIAALSSNSCDLWLFNFATQEWSLWAKENEGTVAFPAWSRDSQFLSFSTMHTANPTFRRIGLGDSDSVSFAGFKDLHVYGG